MSYLAHANRRDLLTSAKLSVPIIGPAALMLGLAFVSSSTAWAQSYEANSQFGLQIHWSEVSASSSHTNDSGQVFSTTGDEMGYGVSASYYFDPTISIRATYERATDFSSSVSEHVGDADIVILHDERGTAEQFSLSLVPQFDISPSLYGFVHIGVARNEFRGDTEGSKTNETSVVYGLGFGYRLAERITLSGEYSRAGSEYDVLRVALGYRF